MEDLRKLRACMVCGATQTFDQFREAGCPNCESFLQLRNSPDRIVDCTTSSFSGLVGMVNNKSSWVARWQRTEKKAPGLYALRVVGRLSEDVEDICRARGIRAVCQ